MCVSGHYEYRTCWVLYCVNSELVNALPSKKGRVLDVEEVSMTLNLSIEMSKKIPWTLIGQRTFFFWNCPKNVQELSVERLDTFWTLNIVHKVSVKKHFRQILQKWEPCHFD